MSANEYDVVIAGGGIAGLTAALTSARLGRRTAVLTGPALGGHLLSIERIDGYPGFPEGIPGYELCPMVQEQAAAAGAEFRAAGAAGLHADEGGWLVATGEGGDLRARAVVVATGTALKPLGVPGEARLRGRGVSHCASCDGPLLRARAVGVVGGGDSALQEALTLAQHASRVIILHRGRAFTAQAAYCRQVQRHPKIEARFDTVVEEVVGDGAVAGVRARDGAGTVAEIELAAVFVYVGLVPATAWLGGALTVDASGRVPADPAMRTGQPGLFAAGSLRSGWAGRAASAAGDGAAAAVAADRYLKSGVWGA
jgi:thioredoxin reductase (NADPH)